MHFSQKDSFLDALQQHQVVDGKKTCSVDDFLPRSFVLCDAQGFQSSLEIFMCHFLYSAALSTIKHFCLDQSKYTEWTTFPSVEQISVSIRLLTLIRCNTCALNSRFFARELHKAFIPFDHCWRPLQLPTCSACRPSIDGVANDEIHYLLNYYKATDNQYHLVQTSNVWILKPARSSQGRGIKLFTTLAALHDHLRHDLQGSQIKRNRIWIVQKYIESPIGLGDTFSQPVGTLEHQPTGSRKFDIRQWVLVTNLSPLQVYWYRHNYARFSSKNYTLRDIDDRFTHLCNHSVQKAYQVSKIVPNTQHSTCIRHSQELQQMLRFVAFFTHSTQLPSLTPMKAATRRAIQAVVPKLQAVGKGFEWLGIDFLIDSELHVWLLEVNISPDMSHDHEILREMVPPAVRDTLHLVMKEDFQEEGINKNGWKLLSIENATGLV
uniref:Tubulintyrosine ligase family putative n=1 Tax=Albugo laibachii Nc14 TaxID=890382 RepID=F0WH99_9STRA|nr:tubulintyrosine ligase family putative [Albugo laibachii Nc14]|eukprot:CCA20615.1 tubulintyrosine ligase family putative [Albugo laibachii Nc14]